MLPRAAGRCPVGLGEHENFDLGEWPLDLISGDVRRLSSSALAPS